jgi:uncharacterized membrane protein HdeD (DUF308 family)
MTSVDSMELRALAHLRPGHRPPTFAIGAAMILLAAAAGVFPAQTVLVVGAAGGWLLWFAGGLMLGVAVLMFTGRLRLIGVAIGLCAIGLGAYQLSHPTVGALAVALILAAALVMDGSFQLAAALHLRPLRAWRWLLASALTSLAAAGLLGAGLSLRTPEMVAMLLCLGSGTTGAALLATGLARPAPRR